MKFVLKKVGVVEMDEFWGQFMLFLGFGLFTCMAIENRSFNHLSFAIVFLFGIMLFYNRIKNIVLAQDSNTIKISESFSGNINRTRMINAGKIKMYGFSTFAIAIMLFLLSLLGYFKQSAFPIESFFIINSLLLFLIFFGESIAIFVYNHVSVNKIPILGTIIFTGYFIDQNIPIWQIVFLSVIIIISLTKTSNIILNNLFDIKKFSTNNSSEFIEYLVNSVEKRKTAAMIIIAMSFIYCLIGNLIFEARDFIFAAIIMFIISVLFYGAIFNSQIEANVDEYFYRGALSARISGVRREPAYNGDCIDRNGYRRSQKNIR